MDKNFKLIICLITFLFIHAFSFSQNISINEVLASNATVNADEDGDYEDWIELYNYGDTAVNLLGFGLSDNYSTPFKWVFPDITVAPGEFLLVWASGKDKIDPALPLHTNFSISAAGEEVILSEPLGAIIDELEPINIPTDISYGRFPDGTGDWKFFTEPTPGAENIGPGYDFLLPKPEFSHLDGVYNEAFYLSITTAVDGASIYYTLDGSEPDENSQLYVSPIYVDSRIGEPNDISMIPTNFRDTGPPYYEGWQPPLGEVFKINVVRARLIHNDAPPGNVETFSYLVDSRGNERYSLPFFSLTTHRDNLFDDDIGIYVHGNHVNYFQDGWERPANLSFFEQNGNLAFKEDIGIRLHGNTTRSRPRKSIRAVARNQYGNSWINYQLFQDKDVDMFKRFILRNSGNDWDWAVFRDAFIQYLAKDLNVGTQYYRPAILFINGEYWGIHNVRDRYDKNYIFSHYGFDEDEMIMMQNNSEYKDGNPGGMSHYNDMLSYIVNNNLGQDSHYEHVMTTMDVESFIDFQLTHIFSKNTDWPGNNTIYWRYIRDDYVPEITSENDGRWRWVILDTDFGFDLPFFYVPGLDQGPAHNTLAFALEESGPDWPNPPWSTFLLRNLINNQQFVEKFINRYCDLLNTAFSSEHVVFAIDSIIGLLEPEMKEHIDRWRRPPTMAEWHENTNVLRSFAQQRPSYQFEHIKQQFGLTGPVNLKVDISNELHGYVRVNTINIKPETMGVFSHPYPWTGKYFIDIPIGLEAIPAPGYQFSHWEGYSTSNQPLITLNLTQDAELKAVFKKSDDLVLIHFWFFGGDIPNNTPLEFINATYSVLHNAKIDYYSSLDGYPFNSGHPSWRKASMERRNAPTNINYRPEANNGVSFEDSDMRAIQIKQPFIGDAGENTVVFSLPTSGFKDIIFKFTAKDESAADMLIIDYMYENEGEWTIDGLTTSEYILLQDFMLYEIDFSGIPVANNNPEFKIRIRFDGDNMMADEGNRVTFNNISLEGNAMTAYNIFAASYGDGAIIPSGNIGVYEGGFIEFKIIADIGENILEVIVDGVCVNDEIEYEVEGYIGYYSFNNVSKDHTIFAYFGYINLVGDFGENPEVILFPNPARGHVRILSNENIKEIEIFDITGKSYHKNAVNSKEHEIYVGNYPKGIYIVRVSTEKGIAVIKLII